MSNRVVCSTCGVEKSIEDFSRWKHSPTGRRRTCKRCQKAYNAKRYLEKRDLVRAKNKAWYQRNREAVIQKVSAEYHLDPVKKMDYDLRTKYGIGADDYFSMLEAQGGVCAICKSGPSGQSKRLHVDHCHKTLKVRALLCASCNLTLGRVNESIETLSGMIEYLERHKP